MAMVTFKINGQAVSAQAGSTVLEAARLADIDIPTLCNHPALAPIGACRMCLVEVKGMPALQTACTFPINEGIDVATESPRVREARKFILELLFSERNHFCMYCEMTGDCELQDLGYRYGLDHWVYPTYTKRFPVDATRQYFIMDHNRCILCRRCVRACGELVANHTLGVKHRGVDSMIQADTDVSFGESSCISCGSCLQVCPTGALVDRRSAFMGRDVETEHVKSICSQCSLGCGMEVVTRAGNVLRLEGDWDAPVNSGLLCEAGRFDVLYDERQRITRPLLRENGRLKETDWDKALEAVAKGISGTKKEKLGVVATANATNEALYLLARLFRDELQASNIGTLSAAAPRLSGNSSAWLAHISESDLILLAGVDPAEGQPVAAMLIRRALEKGARLIVVDGKDNGLAPLASLSLKMAEIGKAIDIVQNADYPVVVYGAGLTEKAAKALRGLDKNAVFVALEPDVNTHAATSLGLDNGFEPSAAQALYVLGGESDWDGQGILAKIGGNAFVAVQASYASPLTERADVVLPMATWSERSGTLTNTEGRVQKANKAIEPAGGAKPDWEILSLLAAALGRDLGTSFDEISAAAVQRLK
jgi:formate dehydrogenase major subunit